MFSKKYAHPEDQHLQMKLRVTFCVDILVNQCLQVLSKWCREHSALCDMVQCLPSVEDENELFVGQHCGFCGTVTEKTDHV